MKVLVAEDNPVNAMLLKHILESVGNEVVVTQDGKEAFDVFSGEDFSAVILDSRMPIMNGVDAMKLMRRHEERHVPIFISSAEDKCDVENLCAEEGFDGYISKPISGSQMLKVIQGYFMQKCNEGFGQFQSLVDELEAQLMKFASS